MGTSVDALKMGEGTVFKVELTTHREPSPAVIRGLEEIQFRIKNVFGPLNAVRRNEVDIR